VKLLIFRSFLDTTGWKHKRISIFYYFGASKGVQRYPWYIITPSAKTPQIKICLFFGQLLFSAQAAQKDKTKTAPYQSISITRDVETKTFRSLLNHLTKPNLFTKTSGMKVNCKKENRNKFWKATTATQSFKTLNFLTKFVERNKN
jgi:hypothetical protein